MTAPTASAKPKLGDPIGAIPDWKPQERPMVPGTPSTPDFPPHIRVAYGMISVLLAVTGSLGNPLVTVNLPAIQGELGISAVQGAWLSTIYTMTNVSMNLLLVKYRQQFGVSSFVQVFLTLYVLAMVAHVFADNYETALAVRAISGVAGAAMGALAIFYMMQAFPAKYRLQSLAIGIGFTQFGVPLARTISPDLIDIGGWHNLYALEAGLAVACLAAVRILKVPHGIRIHAFERQDLVSFLLLATGLGLLVAVFGLGRTLWWREAPWLGWALAASILLIGAGVIFEHYRKNPLIDTRWFLTGSFARFALAVLMVRVLLSEQPVGSTGLLLSLGMAPDQLRHLFALVTAASIVGTLVGAAALAVSMKMLAVKSQVCLLLIAIGAFMDAHATVATHPANLYFSQLLLGFAAGMFMGTALLTGIFNLVKRGLGSIITFAVTFGVTQALGGVLGGAVLGTFQTVRLQHHFAYLSDGLVAANPQTAAAVQMYTGAYTTSVADPALRAATGMSTLTQQVTQQATVLSYNDVFWLIFAFAVAQLAISIAMTVNEMWTARSNPAPTGGGGPAVAV